MAQYDEALTQLVERLPISFSPPLPAAGDLPIVQTDPVTATTFEISSSPESPMLMHVLITPHSSVSAEEVVVDDVDRGRMDALGFKVALMESMGMAAPNPQECLEKLRAFVRQRTLEQLCMPDTLTPLNEGKHLLLYRRASRAQIFLKPATHGFGLVEVVVQFEEHQASAIFDQITFDRFMRDDGKKDFLPTVAEQLGHLVPNPASPIQRIQTSTPVTPSNAVRHLRP